MSDGVEITVIDLPGLANYSKSIKDFANTYSEKTNYIYRQFNEKAGNGSDTGKAVDAYLTKLNSLQNQVFTKFPQSVEKYADIISTYETGLTGLGFQRKCWSSSTGAQAVSNKLTGEQYSRIETKVNGLQNLYNQAASLLGTEAENVSSILEVAETDLTTFGTNRSNMANWVEELYTIFKTSLESSVAEIENFKSVLNNVKYVVSIPASTIVQAIRTGTLAANEMWYLDMISNQDEADAIEAILSDDPGKVMDTDVTNLSKAVYIVLSSEVNQWVAKGDSEKLNALVKRMNNTPVEKNGEFTNRILIAEDALAQTQMNVMYAMYLQREQFEDEALYQNVMATMQRGLDNLNRVTGIFMALQYLEIGYSTDTYHPPTWTDGNIYHYYHKSAKIDLTHDNVLITVDTETKTSSEKYTSYQDIDWSKVGSQNYTSVLSETDLGATAGEYSKRINDLQEARRQAYVDMVSGITTSLITTAISFAPGGNLALATVGLVSNATDVENLASNVSTISSEFGDDYKTVTGRELSEKDASKLSSISKISSGVADAVKSFTGYQAKLAAIQEAADDAKLGLYRRLLDQGGWHLASSDGAETTTRDRYYDFDAMVRMIELDKNGISNYMQSKYPGKSVDQVIKQYEENFGKTVSSEIAAYLKGESTGLSLSNMSAEQLKELSDILSNGEGNFIDNLGTYLGSLTGLGD